jgi:putative Holliday junction resolvase
MIFETIAGLAASLPPRARLLGLDVGKKTVGMAVSDSELKVATALDTIRRTKFTADLEILKAAIAERDIGGLVIGLPVSMDGTEGPACQSIRQFGTNVEERIEPAFSPAFTIGIAYWDERMSTSAVERFLINEADMTRKRRSEVVDKMAAAYILQGALDTLTN